MQKLMWMLGSIIGSSAGWWIGDKFSIGTALVLSTIGMAVGTYLGFKLARNYLA